MWQQTYLLWGHGAGVSAAIAALPVVLLLVLLAGFRLPAWMAALAGLAATLGLAVGGYGMPVRLAVSAAVDGAAFGLFPITWIVFWAIALFRITVDTGNFEIIRATVGRLTSDRREQALLIAFAFGAFVEGAAGFGTPVAISAAMLTGLGFPPFRAAALCLLANTAPVAFGSIGIPLVTLAGTTGLPLQALSREAGRLCAPVSLWIPLYLVVAVGGVRAVRGSLVPAMAAGIAFAGTQFAVSNYIGPQLTDIFASLAAMAALLVVGRLRTAKTVEPAFVNVATEQAVEAASAPGEGTVYTAAQVWRAWSAYALLVACVLVWSFPAVQHWMAPANVVFHWPGLDGRVLRMPPVAARPSPYPALFNLNWLGAAGTSCMVATLLSAVVLGVRPRMFVRVLGETARQLAFPTVTVCAMLGLAFVMNYGGATATFGLAFAATGTVFPFFSALLGWVGVFLTGSDTSANALFGNLQVLTAGRLGLSAPLLAAANSVGGVMGKMISLQNLSVAAAATGMSTAEQTKLFRFTLKHSVFLAAVVGGLTMLYAYGLHW